MLDGRCVLVTGDDAGLGSAIARALDALGAAASTVALADLAGHAGPVDVVVHVPTAGLERAPITATSSDDWVRRCETVLRDALDLQPGPFALLRGTGGLLVFVTPTLGMTGAAELVPYASAVEGMRAMAKSAARQWGGVGIRANCVAPSAEQLRPGTARWSPDVGDPALGAVPAGPEAVVAAIEPLGDERSPITGATIVIDGGVVMVP